MSVEKMTNEYLEQLNQLKEMLAQPPQFDPTIDLRDRKEWGEGPWQHEPDRLEFKTEGFDCLIQRVPHSGHLCGYVAVPEGHPYYGKSYWDLENIDVHGGLTYSEHCQGEICHKADEGSPEVYWFGFDCAHAGDLRPCENALNRAMGWKLPKFSFQEGETYKTIDFVKAEIERLAMQLRLVGEASQLS